MPLQLRLSGKLGGAMDEARAVARSSATQGESPHARRKSNRRGTEAGWRSRCSGRAARANR